MAAVITYRDGRPVTTFRLWAPQAQSVDLMLDQPQAMSRSSDGWFELALDGIAAGTRYRFRIDDEIDVPDPESQFQPDDVSGPSEVIDHSAFPWQATQWRGRPWHEAVFYEAHVGTFTPDGTFEAAIARLDHLVETGITALELMPLADFSGRRNWGYDGVLLYAPDSAYGRPEDLKRLVDAAHARGLMLFLDVVYNHFGPEGNYLSRYAPSFFCEAATPWGNAIDYRVAEVREFAIRNAVHWLENYRFDGLRLDAVHAISAPGTPHLLQSLSERVGDLARRSGRELHLVLENDDNCASWLDPDQGSAQGAYRAQWNDDYHHAWHVLLTGETNGYYEDYAKKPRADVARALSSGFVYQGEHSRHRSRPRGERSAALSPLAFVNFLQNHDQIGNRPRGDRLDTLCDDAKVEAALAVTLLAPSIPLLFMGEEFGARQPFPFFCDFHGELAEAVRKGRKAEFAHFFATGGDIPDPLADETFRSAILDWPDSDNETAQRRLMLVRDLLRIRRTEIMPRLTSASFAGQTSDGAPLQVAWRLGAETLRLTANLSEHIVSAPPTPGRVLWGRGDAEMAPWHVRWQLDGGP